MYPAERQCPIHAKEIAARLDRTLPSGVRRVGYLVLGWLALVAGVIGVVVPVWPTTCFLLLAAWSFSRSSRRMYRWLHENRLFGEHLKIYRETGRISRGVRNVSLSALWLTIGISAVLAARVPWVPVVLLALAVAITVHLVRIPVHPRQDPEGASSGG